MRPFGPEDALVLVSIALVVTILVACGINSVRREARAEADEALGALSGLIVLDPALLKAFGKVAQYRDRDSLTGTERDADGYLTALDLRKVARLAATQRTREERRSGRDELAEALAALKEARS